MTETIVATMINGGEETSLKESSTILSQYDSEMVHHQWR